ALERHPQLRIRVDERPRDAVADRPGLTRRPAAVHADAHVVAAVETGDLQWRTHLRPVDEAREVLVERAPVDPPRPVAGAEDDSGHRRLALAGALVLGARRRWPESSSAPATGRGGST